jgi:hypothetical protein
MIGAHSTGEISLDARADSMGSRRTLDESLEIAAADHVGGRAADV